MSEHEKFINEVVNLANENVTTGKGGPFAALVVKDGKVKGRGTNSVTAGNDPTAHAEIVAIRNACKNLNHYQLTDCLVYTSCEPCPMCLGAIYWARPKLVVFAAGKDDAAKAGFDDSFIYEQIALPYHQRAIVAVQVKNKEFFTPFQTWINSSTKTEY